jgi:hypothetical protein
MLTKMGLGDFLQIHMVTLITIGQSLLLGRSREAQNLIFFYIRGASQLLCAPHFQLQIIA